VYDTDDDDEEHEMVIELPTDVKHVAHIGWDGGTSTSLCSWNHAAPPPDSAAASTSSSSAPVQQQQEAPPPLPPLSMRQFELAMAAGSGTGHQHHS
jgi:hypothetical protein